MVYEPIDNRDNAGGIGEHLSPVTEGFVGCYDGGLEFVAPIDDVKQQISMAIGVTQISDLIQ